MPDPRDAGVEAARKIVDRFIVLSTEGETNVEAPETLVQAIAAYTDAAVKGKDEHIAQLERERRKADQLSDDHVRRLIDDVYGLTVRLAAAEGEVSRLFSVLASKEEDRLHTDQETTKAIEELIAERDTLKAVRDQLRVNVAAITEKVSRYDREVGELKAAVEQALARIDTTLRAASEERYQEMARWEAEALKWKAEGDMYGWNFFQGMKSGANWCDIIYRRIGREVAAIREERAALIAVSSIDIRPATLSMETYEGFKGSD